MAGAVAALDDRAAALRALRRLRPKNSVDLGTCYSLRLPTP